MNVNEQANSPPGARGPLALLIAGASLPFLAKLAAIGLAAATGASSYPLQSLYKLFQLAVPVAWRRRYGGQRGLACLWPIDEPLPGAGTWAIAVATAAGLSGTAIATVLLLAPALAIDPAGLRAGLDAKFAMTPWRAALVVVYLFSLNAALEELHFRAWLDREISARFGASIGIASSATAFSAMHLFIFAGLPGASGLVLALVFLALLVAGVLWSLIARRPGGIHAAWLSHGLTDAGLLTWGLFWLGYF